MLNRGVFFLLTTQFEQMELRKKEEEAEKATIGRRRKQVREMYDESIRMAQDKRDAERREQNIFDMDALERNLAGIDDEKIRIAQSKVRVWIYDCI